MNDFHSTTSFLRIEREWEGRREPWERGCSSKSLKILKFFTLSLHLSCTHSGAHFFFVFEPIQGFVQRPLDSDSGWQELFFLYESFLFSVGFARVLQSLLSRYMPEIYRIFTLLYALIVPAKIIFFQHRCDCVYGKSSGNHDLLQKAYPVSIEINPTVIGL